MQAFNTTRADQLPVVYEGDWHIDSTHGPKNQLLAFVETIHLGSLIFRGELSNGVEMGKKSAAARIAPINAGRIKSLSFTVRGDGRTYNMVLKNSTINRRGPSYHQSFQTQAGKLSRITLDMEQFLAKAYGRSQMHIPPLFLQDIDIDTIGISISDSRPGGFFLNMHPISINRFKQTENRIPIPEEAATELEKSVVKGVSMFINGDASSCCNLYTHAITSVLSKWKNALPKNRQRRLRQTLWSTQSATTDAQKAWILRYGIDDALQNKSA